MIENAGPGAMTDRSLGYEAMREVRPDLVYVAVSPFGQTGPYSHHQTTDLTLAAMGGSMSLTGDLDRRPVRVSVPQTWHHAAAESAVGAMIAHHRRVQTGESQFVDVSVQAAVFWTGLNAMIASAIDGKNIERIGSGLALSTIQTELVYPCRDGEVCLMAAGQTVIKLLPWMQELGVVTPEWVAAEEWTTYDRRLIDGGVLVYSFEIVKQKIVDFTMTLTKAELFAGAIERNVTVVPVNTAADTVSMAQLEARDAWDEGILPGGQKVRVPGAFVKVSGAPIAWSRPAPLIDEGSEHIRAELPHAVPDDSPAKVPAQPRTALPLSLIHI